MNGQELLQRGVRLDLARERGAYTPNSTGYLIHIQVFILFICVACTNSITCIFLIIAATRTVVEASLKLYLSGVLINLLERMR